MRYSGKIGFISDQVETSPGVIEEVYNDHLLRGDVTKASYNLSDPNVISDDLSLGNIISVVADKYSYENFSNIRYATYIGAKWKVTAMSINGKRIELMLGGVWNG